MNQYTLYEYSKTWTFRIAVILVIATALIFATEFAAEATHRATGPCDDCSRYSWLARQMCNFDNWINRCRSGH